MFCFFFSSRRRHTRFKCDWSSDVCSSDLAERIGTGADPLRGATLVFEGNTITSIDPSGQVPRDADVVDAGHLTVMPGMIDCHVHLSSSPWGVQERLLMPYS